ncbi:uncharacterized protein [Onthophagus taurus]|uniref:uncharacterized protein n=1 Tax=Onthophagus taurus TaxID=166361 RepID=UPI0039BE2D05
MEIKDFESLVTPFLKRKKFVSCDCKSLLGSGENYGSTLLAVDVKVINEDGKEEVVKCVGKTTPPTEMLWSFFNTKETFKKEIALYDTITPILNNFGQKKGIENIFSFIPKCFGARLSINPNSTEVDRDGVLLLENLKVSGYDIDDRFNGFSKECAELILKDLAVFHATPLAYKLEYPNEFDKTLKPYLKKSFFYSPSEALFEVLKPAASKNPKCASLINKIDHHWDDYNKWVKGEFEIRELFATITHQDFWVNNTMIKFKNKEPISNMMVDFQIIEYESLAHDLIFFLYSSVQIDVLEEHVDGLIDFYFEAFIGCLKDLRCDTSKFTKKAFDEEIEIAAKQVQLTHILYMLFPMLKLKGEALDLKDVNGEGDIFQNSEIYHENFAKRLHFVLLDFEKRGWLNNIIIWSRVHIILRNRINHTFIQVLFTFKQSYLFIMDIKCIEQVIEPVLKNGTKYVSHQCKNLLSLGENYGSVMLDVKIKVDKDGEEETLCCVGKTTPQSAVIWKMFNTSVTFKKEISFYHDIVPTLNEFGEEKGIKNIMHFTAKCVGARISLDPNSTEVDTDAILLLENIKVKGFTVADRFIGFNMDETKLILRDLAVFHATPLALKLQKPEVFNKKIRPYLNRDFNFKPEEESFQKFMSLIKEKTSSNPKLGALLERIENMSRKAFDLVLEKLDPNELYATMVHNDFWVNNTMLKYDENGKVIENIMVDFQVLEYNSPATDLLFLLYSSVQLEVIENNVDYFIRYYFDHFLETLKKLDCDTEQFTFDTFLDDIDFIGKNYQANHVIIMLQPIYTKKGEAKDLSNATTEEDILADGSSMHDNYAKKLEFVLLEFEKRGWI